MDKIEIDVSLLGLAKMSDRLADACIAFGNSLRGSEEYATADRVEIAQPTNVFKLPPESPAAPANEEPERVFVDPAKIFGAPQAPIVETLLSALPRETVIPLPPAAISGTVPLAPLALQATGELDVAGHAWDERIHSGTRAKNKDGTWRTKRGVSAGVVAAVEAEMKAGPPATKAPGVPVPPPPVAAPADGLKFNDVVKRVQAGISAGTFTQADLTAQCKTLGLGSFPELAKRPDLFASLLANLGL